MADPTMVDPADPFTPDQLAWLEARYRASISTPSSVGSGYPGAMGEGSYSTHPGTSSSTTGEQKGRMGVTIVQTYGEYKIEYSISREYNSI